MRERPEGTTQPTGLKVLIFFCVTTLLVPIAILVLCAVSISLRKYPLPGVFLVLYVLAALASPIMGVSLVIF